MGVDLLGNTTILDMVMLLMHLESQHELRCRNVAICVYAKYYVIIVDIQVANRMDIGMSCNTGFQSATFTLLCSVPHYILHY